MSFDNLIIALGLVLVIEGLMPFISPANWREALIKIAQLDDSRIRLFGLTSMLIGLVLVWLAT